MPGRRVNVEVTRTETIQSWSQDGYSPCKVTLRLVEGDDVAWVTVRVDCLPDGRNGWWRAPSSNNVRRWVDRLLTNTKWAREGQRELTTPSYMQHWQWRYDLKAR